MKIEKLQKALNTIYQALECYAEDCISSDKAEIKRLDKAWDTLNEFIKSDPRITFNGAIK